jgi:hypothetical protein
MRRWPTATVRVWLGVTAVFMRGLSWGSALLPLGREVKRK